jgi:hypothetical protein
MLVLSLSWQRIASHTEAIGTQVKRNACVTFRFESAPAAVAFAVIGETTKSDPKEYCSGFSAEPAV